MVFQVFNFKRSKEKTSNGCKSDYASKKLPTIRYLSRIINYLIDYNEECNMSKISVDCGLTNEDVKKSVLWLSNNKILIKVHKSKGKLYSINSEWKKLKDGK